MIPDIHKLDNRRKELGLSYAALSQRSKVSQATVVRLLSGRNPHISLQNVVAIAEALGFELVLSSTVSVHELRKQQAREKARRLVALMQGTSGLEAQALVSSEDIDDMTDETACELLSGSSRRLWGK